MANVEMSKGKQMRNGAINFAFDLILPTALQSSAVDGLASEKARRGLGAIQRVANLGEGVGGTLIFMNGQAAGWTYGISRGVSFLTEQFARFGKRRTARRGY